MNPSPIAPSHHLSADQVAAFRRDGYLTGLPPVFSREEMARHRAELPQLLALLRPGETAKDIREWHEASRWLYDLCMHPRILDLVEGIVGPDLFLWASNFFIKPPRSAETVGWHQDAYYWPLSPHRTVTVWLAFDDVDEENGAMRVIPGSHRAGLMRHQRSTATDSVLTLELEGGQFREDSAVALCLRAGCCSLHDDAMVHGSPANASARPRVGLTMRYSATEVRNDLAVNPHFKAYLCRGVDRYRHNPLGTIPTARFGRTDFHAVSREEAGDGA